MAYLELNRKSFGGKYGYEGAYSSDRKKEYDDAIKKLFKEKDIINNKKITEYIINHTSAIKIEDLISLFKIKKIREDEECVELMKDLAPRHIDYIMEVMDKIDIEKEFKLFKKVLKAYLEDFYNWSGLLESKKFKKYKELQNLVFEHKIDSFFGGEDIYFVTSKLFGKQLDNYINDENLLDCCLIFERIDKLKLRENHLRSFTSEIMTNEKLRNDKETLDLLLSLGKSNFAKFCTLLYLIHKKPDYTKDDVERYLALAEKNILSSDVLVCPTYVFDPIITVKEYEAAIENPNIKNNQYFIKLIDDCKTYWDLRAVHIALEDEKIRNNTKALELIASMPNYWCKMQLYLACKNDALLNDLTKLEYIASKSPFVYEMETERLKYGPTDLEINFEIENKKFIDSEEKRLARETAKYKRY